MPTRKIYGGKCNRLKGLKTIAVPSISGSFFLWVHSKLYTKLLRSLDKTHVRNWYWIYMFAGLLTMQKVSHKCTQFCGQSIWASCLTSQIRVFFALEKVCRLELSIVEKAAFIQFHNLISINISP